MSWPPPCQPTPTTVTPLRSPARHIGRRYHLRIDLYSINMFVLGSALSLLLVAYVMSPEQFDQTFSGHVLVGGTCMICCVCLARIVLAAEECNQAYRYRTLLQRERLAASSRAVVEGGTAGLAAAGLLSAADAACGYEEEIVDPTTVLGVPASAMSVGTVLGLIAVGLGVFLEGYVKLGRDGWGYGDDGRYELE